jgi:hypothetical protein
MVSAHIESTQNLYRPFGTFPCLSLLSLLSGTSVPGFQVPPLGGWIRGKCNIGLASKIRVDP